jgi:imidazolonepropionase-like amidohydrolase
LALAIRIISAVGLSYPTGELMQMQNEIGTVDPGRYADIIAVQGNRLQDISVMQKPAFVMKGGGV